MTWIETISVERATGRLRRSYDAAIQRAGRVFGVGPVGRQDPSILDASMGLYQKVMYAKQGLSRRQRELLATVVSRANACHY